jgi:hypothetical protein
MAWAWAWAHILEKAVPYKNGSQNTLNEALRFNIH